MEIFCPSCATEFNIDGDSGKCPACQLDIKIYEDEAEADSKVEELGGIKGRGPDENWVVGFCKI